MKGQTILFLINTFSGMGYSIVAPLFPLLGESEGINEELIGLIISIYSIMGTITIPFVPTLCKKYSRIKLLYLATFFEASCTIFYGLLNYISSFYFLLFITFLSRFLHGIASGIIEILIYSLTCSLSNVENLQYSLGSLEVGWSLGISSGPICASIFYKIGGYSLPFIALGCLLYVSVYLTKFIQLEEKADDEIESESPFMKFVFYKDIFIIILALVFGMISCTYYYPSLTNHLMNNYGLSVSVSSLFFVIGVVFYALGIEFLDQVSKKIGMYTMIVIGFFCVAISSYFTYPSWPIPKNIFWVIFSFALKGMGNAPLFVTTVIVISKAIINMNPNVDELGTNDISSAIVNLSFSIGDFVGPIIGGFLSNHFGFSNSCLIITILLVSYAIFFFLYFYKNIREDLRNRYNEENNNDKNSIEDNNIDNQKNKLNNYSLSGFFSGVKINNIKRRSISSVNFINKRKLRTSDLSLYTSLTS